MKVVTNWQKDGDPRDAALLTLTQDPEIRSYLEANNPKALEQAERALMWSAPLSCLELPTRIQTVLEKHGVLTVGGLCLLTTDELRGLGGLGWMSVGEIWHHIRRVGLCLEGGLREAEHSTAP